ncbi:hypothetical protein [Streptomyces gilvus]|uniref:hypothetical protein n=1 Tax=Streptomyces gilvus TaxID=2920937 RepID=UPI001F0F5B5B|nr:hypothetical protein [Streptomyces sp. CME 23]MCH5674933.1 hypothetical protein [Streptomyces sp. CME 23]
MLFASGMTRFAHGLVIVAAPGVDGHEGWDAGNDVVHGGPDSLFIAVQQAASGPFSVECVQGPCQPDGKVLVYSGRLTLPQAAIEISDPNESLRLLIPVPNIENQVEVYGDGSDEPDAVTIVLTGEASW